MKVMFSVTGEDIKHGNRSMPGSCPIARAAKRTFGAGSIVSVGSDKITVDGKSVTLTPEAADFVKNFDNKKTVAPFSFIVDLPL